MKPGQPFADLPALAAHLRGELENKKTILLFASFSWCHENGRAGKHQEAAP